MKLAEDRFARRRELLTPTGIEITLTITIRGAKEMKENYLLIPGPAPIPHTVLGMSTMFNHRGPRFKELITVNRFLKRVFQTEGRLYSHRFRDRGYGSGYCQLSFPRGEGYFTGKRLFWRSPCSIAAIYGLKWSGWRRHGGSRSITVALKRS